MKVYEIRETLAPSSLDQAISGEVPFVAVLSPAEWRERRAAFDMGIDMEPDVEASVDTQAEANYDAVTGTIFIPDRADPDLPEARFAFAFDEKGVVFIDAKENAETIVRALARSKRWRRPGLARFLAEFIAQIVRGDAAVLRAYEDEIDNLEEAIMSDRARGANNRINAMRSELRDLDDHYDHLMDLTQVLEDNENGFFGDEELRVFHSLYGRLDKLRDQAISLRDQAVQLRDTYKMHLDIKQNHIVTALTIVTAIFAPLTLIVGWYGMNFEHMPELHTAWGYPAVALLCVTVVSVSLFDFKRRHWI